MPIAMTIAATTTQIGTSIFNRSELCRNRNRLGHLTAFRPQRFLSAIAFIGSTSGEN